jgi:transposase-like protein
VFDNLVIAVGPAAVAKLESIIWPNGPVCVHCGEANRVGRLNGKSTKIGTLKCYACKKKFSATVGTVFEDSHVPVHQWLQAVYLICSSKKGVQQPSDDADHGRAI